MIKSIRTLGTCMLFASVLCLGFTACDSKDDEAVTSLVNPTRVFSGTRIKSLDDMNFTYDSKGFLTSIKEEDNLIAFEYPASDEVVVSKTYASNPKEKAVMVFTIGKNGFASKCIETYTSESETTVTNWTFEYNDGGYLTLIEESSISVKRFIEMDYNNFNMIKSTVKNALGAVTSSNTITYTSTEVTTPMENKGGVMLWDDILDVDIDYMIYAYYAGFLGLPTKHLPIANIEDEGNGYIYPYSTSWTLNEGKYPIKAEQKSTNSAGADVFTFTWQGL